MKHRRQQPLAFPGVGSRPPNRKALEVHCAGNAAIAFRTLISKPQPFVPLGPREQFGKMCVQTKAEYLEPMGMLSRNRACVLYRAKVSHTSFVA